jgi:hypothetical protein
MLIASVAYANLGEDRLIFTVPEYSVYMNTFTVMPVDQEVTDFFVDYRFTPEGKSKYLEQLKKQGFNTEELKNFTAVTVNYQTKNRQPVYRTGTMIFYDENADPKNNVVKQYKQDFTPWTTYNKGSQEEIICGAARYILREKLSSH